MLDNLVSPTHLLIVLPVVALYLLPTWISIKRHHPHHVYIALTNIFIGGTGVGWTIALLWALGVQIVVFVPRPEPKQ